MNNYLEFEKSIAELEGKIEELRHLSGSGDVNIADEVGRLQGKVEKLLVQAYTKLTPWQKTQVARHHDRPHAANYIEGLIEDFTPLAGDRQFAEDKAVIGGLGRFRGASVVVIGNEKGFGTEGRLKHNFGMARPEGYRKAQRLMKLADSFGLPVITLIDTPGAYPGVDAEARGQAEAVARSIETCLGLKVPVVSVIIGEGGSGGAIVLLSSVASRLGGAGSTIPYAASKGAVDSFGWGLAQEVAGEGILVNVVSPGIIDTEIQPAGRVEAMGPKLPFARAGQAFEPAAAILWLLSDDASYVSGANLSVSGAR